MCVCIGIQKHPNKCITTANHTYIEPLNTTMWMCACVSQRTRLLFGSNRPPATIHTHIHTPNGTNAKQLIHFSRTQMAACVLLYNNVIINFSELSYLCVCGEKATTKKQNHPHWIRIWAFQHHHNFHTYFSTPFQLCNNFPSITFLTFLFFSSLSLFIWKFYFRLY